MRPADDAQVLDSSTLSIADVVSTIVKRVRGFGLE
jgi:cytidylate kinase